jgi:predicted O-methyltransferase YrrM
MATTTSPPRLPSDFDAVSEQALARVRRTPGLLSEKEARFLVLAAACAPARGAILEIGSFKGRSTVALATVAVHYGTGPVVAVDPHTAPSSTDPDLEGRSSSFEEFLDNLRASDLEGAVEIHRTYSRDLARGWNRPIRLLWIDGDHTYEGAKEDLRLFGPHLAEGAIVAIHDVLNAFEGPIRLFLEDVLRSNDFGPAGLCGSIGWGQYRPRDGGEARFGSMRVVLARRVERLVQDAPRRNELTGIRRLRYKLHRALVPHGTVDPGRWLMSTAMDR